MKKIPVKEFKVFCINERWVYEYKATVTASDDCYFIAKALRASHPELEYNQMQKLGSVVLLDNNRDLFRKIRALRRMRRAVDY